MKAAYENSPPAVVALLSTGRCDTTIRDINGETALDLALGASWRKECADLLQDYEKNPAAFIAKEAAKGAAGAAPVAVVAAPLAPVALLQKVRRQQVLATDAFRAAVDGSISEAAAPPPPPPPPAAALPSEAAALAIDLPTELNAAFVQRITQSLAEQPGGDEDVLDLTSCALEYLEYAATVFPKARRSTMQ